jgi:Fic family protein
VHPVVPADPVEERVNRFHELVSKADPEVLAKFNQRFDMSWIYHDSAIEGVVYSQEELMAAITQQTVSDPAMLPAYDEIRQHKAAIDLIRSMAEKKKQPITLDTIKLIYCALAPEENEAKGPPKYRKEMPVHRLYFHEIAAPDKIAPKMRALIDWVNSPEARRATHPVRLAAKAHYQLLHIYPFTKHSGKVARLFMNLLLLRHGFPPVIIHSTERQTYYESLRAEPNEMAALVHTAFRSSVESAIKFFENLGYR